MNSIFSEFISPRDLRTLLRGLGRMTLMGMFAAATLAGATCLAADAKKIAAEYFAARPELEDKDLISHRDVEPLLTSLRKSAWPGTDELARRVLDDQHPLVQTLDTTAGRKLIRKVCDYPLVYDRLDRLSVLPGGTTFITTLTKLPDGPSYLRENPTPGLKNLAELLPKGPSGFTPEGKDFDKPTGRVYTPEQLLRAIDDLQKAR